MYHASGLRSTTPRGPSGMMSGSQNKLQRNGSIAAGESGPPNWNNTTPTLLRSLIQGLPRSWVIKASPGGGLKQPAVPRASAPEGRQTSLRLEPLLTAFQASAKSRALTGTASQTWRFHFSVCFRRSTSAWSRARRRPTVITYTKKTPQTSRYAAITLPRFFNIVRSSSPSPRQTARARRSSPHRLRGRYPLEVGVAAFCFDSHFFYGVAQRLELVPLTQHHDQHSEQRRPAGQEDAPHLRVQARAAAARNYWLGVLRPPPSDGHVHQRHIQKRKDAEHG